LREPIWIYDGQILDGRNRWRACEVVGVEPESREYQGDDPLGFVLSLNLHRRHLTDGQKAVLALDILPLMEAEARERMSEAASEGVEFVPPPEAGKSRDHAAAAVGVNPRYVSDAKRIAREAPELVEKLRAGALTVPAAMRQLKEDQRKADLARPVRVDLAPGLHRGRHACGSRSPSPRMTSSARLQAAERWQPGHQQVSR